MKVQDPAPVCSNLLVTEPSWIHIPRASKLSI